MEIKATDKVTVLAKQNPKRGKSKERFALYSKAKTVEEYVKLCVEKTKVKAGKAMADVRWDLQREYIKLG